MKGKLSTIILAALLVVAGYFAFVKKDNVGDTTPTKSLKSDTNPQTQPIQPPAQQSITTPTNGEPDAYGRLPGDEHYGHSHGTETQPATQQPNIQPAITPPADGQPDAYGRMPGDEHYGHSHE